MSFAAVSWIVTAESDWRARLRHGWPG
ncbi:MAG: hypothetical protein K0S83_1387, partial [Thermomicrobiales bacterium]|nr:hypothetical protein [Thermomicrobiales bacterium]